MKGYIIVKEECFRDELSIPALRERNDEEWINIILNYFLLYYRDMDKKEIQNIIERESLKEISKIETGIRNHIVRWLRRKYIFYYRGFKVNSESLASEIQESYYDIKVEHSNWNRPNSYFAFECKKIGKFKHTSLMTSINEYVYIKTKNREDGGMFRYFSGKYAVNQNFGGMIGFVISNSNRSPIELIKKKILEIYDKDVNGKLIEEKIVDNSINDNENTFDSIHDRHCNSSIKEDRFVLHHILMDFAISLM